MFDDTARDIARSMQELAARFHEQENIINCYFEQLKARIGNIQEDSLLAIKIFKENSFQ